MVTCNMILQGLAMDAEDQATLHDVYQLFHKEKAVEQTAYIMQFLWRDLTSSYDIVGPYFTSSEVFSAKFILAEDGYTSRWGCPR